MVQTIVQGRRDGMLDENASIAIAGAGSIGCYVGGCLALADRKVTLLARPQIATAIRESGLQITDFEGRDRSLRTAQIDVTDDPATAFAKADVILVTVKSGATAEMADLIDQHAWENAAVVSLQNGVGNVKILRAGVGHRRVLPGMVPFNIVQFEGTPLRFHRASEGDVLIGEGVTGLAELLSVEGCAVKTHADMKAVSWGKLLLNLNNALVALSGLPLAAQLSDRRWRRILAAQIAEALAVMKAAGIRPASVAGAPPSLLPAILRLPDWIYRRLARRMLEIDPQARSSMWDDLQRGRSTEIDELQGAIVALAQGTGVATPLSNRIVVLVHTAETDRRGSPGLPPEQIMPDA